jgi:regulator of telomere elongation helicase 1
MDDEQNMSELEGVYSQESNEKRSVSKKKARGYTSFKMNQFEVKFPFEPYEIQKKYIFKVLKSCHKRENALLESPTGTGKTLSLLWGALAWLDTEMKECDNGVKRPKIIYSSRTHSQLTQVIDELKRTPYFPRTALIASRDHMWIHKELSKLKGNPLNIACNKATRGGYNGIHCHLKGKVEEFFTIEQRKNEWDIQDIEELHKLGNRAGVCPYFLQKERAKHADLILMPYQYLIDQKIRENFDINYNNAVVIVDEAHNIGSVCEEVASLDLTDVKLDAISKELLVLKNGLENKDFNESKFGKFPAYF